MRHRARLFSALIGWPAARHLQQQQQGCCHAAASAAALAKVVPGQQQAHSATLWPSQGYKHNHVQLLPPLPGPLGERWPAAAAEAGGSGWRPAANTPCSRGPLPGLLSLPWHTGAERGSSSSRSSSCSTRVVGGGGSTGTVAWQRLRAATCGPCALAPPTGALLSIAAGFSSVGAEAPSSSSSSSSSGCRGGAANASVGSGSGSGGGSPSWVDRRLPSAVRPYAHLMRLDKPIGSWLLAWPGLWSIALAAPPGQLPDLHLTALFAVGAVLMRGAGCTINDLWDRDIDRQVERTRGRPLASGAVTPPRALAFLAAQLSASLAVLLQLNAYAQALGVASLALVATYPLMKRVTWWPQAFLGLCMNYGALMGYAAAAGACDWAVVLPLYAAGVNWTLVYDTVYAHQDKRDDARVGVRSTALLFGRRTKSWASAFAAAQAALLAAAGAAAGCGAPYFAAVAAGAAHQAWQVADVDLDDGPDCMAKFVSNKWYGAVLYGGIVADRLLAAAAAA